jgi:AcrR family transcriptional regulator
MVDRAACTSVYPGWVGGATVTQSQRAAETCGRILDAAAVLFDLHGYLGTSMNDLLGESRVTKGAFYFHFPSKESLAVAIVQSQYDA